MALQNQEMPLSSGFNYGHPSIILASESHPCGYFVTHGCPKSAGKSVTCPATMPIEHCLTSFWLPLPTENGIHTLGNHGQGRVRVPAKWTDQRCHAMTCFLQEAESLSWLWTTSNENPGCMTINHCQPQDGQMSMKHIEART